jgi:hypothetical protein
MLHRNAIRAAATAVLAIALAVTGCSKKSQQAAAGDAPVITAARIVPDQPLSTSTLGVQFELGNAGDQDVTCSTEWYLNGKLAATVEGTEYLLDHVAPGTTVKARITARDTSGSSAPYETQAVVVQENLSGLDSVRLSPSPVRSGTTTVTATPFLPAGASANLKISYHWIVGGKDQGETGPVIGVSGLKNGDKITVEATALIGGQKGNPFRVTAVVTNDAPVIQSIAVASQDSAVIRYQITATDPDNDPLSYQLVSGPDGVAIDGAGLITVPRAVAGKAIRVKVGDNAGNWIERNLETGQ